MSLCYTLLYSPIFQIFLVRRAGIICRPSGCSRRQSLVLLSLSHYISRGQQRNKNKTRKKLTQPVLYKQYAIHPSRQISTPKLPVLPRCYLSSRVITYADNALIATHPSGPRGAYMFVRYTCAVAVGAVHTPHASLSTSAGRRRLSHVSPGKWKGKAGCTYPHYR